MRIRILEIDNNCGKNFRFKLQDARHGHLFVRFKSDATVNTVKGYKKAQAGDFIFFEQDEIMEYGSENNDFVHDYFRFYLSEEERALFDIPTSILYSFPLSNKLENIFNLMAGEFYSSSKCRNESLEYLGKLFLINASLFVKDEKGDPNSVKHQKLLDLRVEILNSPQKSWSVNELSKKVSLSPSYFQNLYTKTFGISCVNDIIDARIKKAKLLLISTDKTESEISEMCGYNSVEHFTRQFKKRTGINPSAYRADPNAKN